VVEDAASTVTLRALLSRVGKAGRLRVLGAALAAATLAGLVATELTIQSVRNWWAERPLTSATVTGVLLLALAVLVLEAVVNGILTRTEQRRWRSAAKAAAAILMSGVSTAMSEFQQTTLWSATVAVDSFEEIDPEVQAEAARLGSTLTRSVLDVAGILTATVELEALYEHAAVAAGAARDLPEAIRVWIHSDAANLLLPTFESESARLAWWSGVVRTWDRVVEEMSAFQAMAERELGLASDGNYAWGADGPGEFAKARRAHVSARG
jgi:hypothetical protein